MGLFDRFRSHPAVPSSASPVRKATVPVPAVAPQNAVSSRAVSSGAGSTDDLVGRLRALIRPGFLDYADVRQRAIELLGEDADIELTEAQIGALVDRLWDERVEQANGWPDFTDFDRLALAFAWLEVSGIVARMSFTCCQTCGHAEIADERATGTEQGYAFFHQRDAARLADEPARLWVAFGSFVEASPEADELIGVSVAQALADQGLIVEWDGTAAGRIRVNDLYVRQRLSPRPAT